MTYALTHARVGDVFSASSISVLVFLSASSLLAQQAPPAQVRHATYDFTEGPMEPNLDLPEVWVDTKSPGDGITYTVGTVSIQRARADIVNPLPVTFSEQPIGAPAPLQGFTQLPAGGPAQRQVVVVQAVDEADQGIVWQSFYYGVPEGEPRPSNARGISVWPEENLEDTRVAICGESTSPGHPLDQGGSNNAGWKGFVAVFDGLGTHLWSHTFYGETASAATAGDVAITDLSIRVVDGVDVVTYCGISTIGTVGLAPGSMVPVAPFVAPLPPTACPNETRSDGAVDTDGWDGFVGRLTVDAQGQRTIVFHSVVGGAGNNGLFGIAEVTADRFIVVGSTELQGAGGGGTFPLTDDTCFANGAMLAAYRVGAVMEFDASAIPGGLLELNWAQRIGTGPYALEPTLTSARDVVVQRGFDPAFDLVAVVGQTDDEQLFLGGIGGGSNPGYVGPQAALAGLTDGYVLTGVVVPGGGVFAPYYATFRGGPGEDALTGVQSWNEFPDHFATIGYVNDQLVAPDEDVSADIELSSYWVNTSNDVSNPPLVEVRRVNLGNTGSYQPTALGAVHAGFEFLQGGGVAVGASGRITGAGAFVDVVDSYAESGPPQSMQLDPGRANNNPEEAYRVVLDPLPDNAGRTDGTGVNVPAPGPQYPLAAFFGGSSPECALSAFGNQVGQAPPANPLLSRMLIDYVGPNPAAGASMTLVVDRPPTTPLLITAWQLGFPGVGAGGPPAAPLVLPEGTLLWTVNSPATYVIPTPGSLSQTWTLPVGGGGTITAQLFCMLDPADAIPGGAVGPVCPGLSTTAASPALWFTF